MRRVPDMLKKMLRRIKPLFQGQTRTFTYEPVTHRLDPHPVLPQSMMEAVSPAYEEVLAREKAQEGEEPPQE